MALPYASRWVMERLGERYQSSLRDLILFYSPLGPWGFLASCHENRFPLEGTEWRSIEHYYQAAKFPHRPELICAIRTATSPLEAKAIAARHREQRLPEWHAVRDSVMQRADEAKFTSCRRFMRMLLSTGTRPIAEVSFEDRYWGCGADGSGRNRSGELLMELRAVQCRRRNPFRHTASHVKESQ